MRRALSCVLCAFALACSLERSALAQQPATSSSEAAAVERRILLLRAEDKPPSATEARIDRVLGQALAEMGFIVNVSPMPFRDAQLALGCQGSLRKCGGSVAGALESEQLGVTSVEQSGTSRAGLSLYLFSSGIEREASAEISLESSAAFAAAVRELARRVYGDAAPEPRAIAQRAQAERKRVEPPAPEVVAASAEPTTVSATAISNEPIEPERNQALRAVGWSTASVGGALLVSGFATSLASRNSGEAYADRQVLSRADADDALASYERAERQADAARVLFGTGGALLVSGAVMLLWERIAPGHQDRKLQFSAVPAVRGVALSLAGSFEGRSR